MKFQPIWRCWSCGAKLPNGERLDCEDCDQMLDQANTDYEMRLRGAWMKGVNFTGEQGIVAQIRRELEGTAL